MVALGHEVLAIAPEDDPAVARELGDGHPVPARCRLHRAGMNPLRDSLTVDRPDPDLPPVPRRTPSSCTRPSRSSTARWRRGSRGCRCASAMITGIGSALGGGAGRRRGLRRVAASGRLYWIGLRGRPRGVLPEPGRRAPVPVARPGRPRASASVRVGGFGDRPHGVQPGTAARRRRSRFLLIARLSATRACRVHRGGDAVRADHPAVTVRAARTARPQPDGDLAGELDGSVARASIEYLGVASDVRPHIAAAHVIVLPSYGEGMPAIAAGGDGHGAVRC